jgi:multidrug efflux pump subunit AcrB
VATPLERLLWQIDGVEYVYSMSHQDMAVVTVRFYVGEERENSILKVHNRIAMYQDEAPPIVRGWVVKPIEIDDVPIVNLTLFSDRYDDHELRRMGEEVLARLSAVKDISRTQIVGGRSREVRVELLPERMVGLGVSLPEVRRALMGADASVTAGTFSRANQSTTVTANAFLTSAGEVGGLVVGVHEGRPVYLRDVASIVDGPREADTYSRIGYAHYYRSPKRPGRDGTRSYPAVTLALAKKKGTNAVTVAANILDELETLKKEVLPDGVWVEITRNYGDTAQQKVNELLSLPGVCHRHVVILLAFSLGWREALVVALAVPISFSLALFVNYLFRLHHQPGHPVCPDSLPGPGGGRPHHQRGQYPAPHVQRHPRPHRQRHVRRQRGAAAGDHVHHRHHPLLYPLFFITGMMGPYMAPWPPTFP